MSRPGSVRRLWGRHRRHGRAEPTELQSKMLHYAGKDMRYVIDHPECQDEVKYLTNLGLLRYDEKLVLYITEYGMRFMRAVGRHHHPHRRTADDTVIIHLFDDDTTPMRISVTNVGPLRHIELPLDDLTVIVGRSGTGKSTLLKALYCMLRPSGDSDQTDQAITDEFGSLSQFIGRSDTGKAVVEVADGDVVSRCEVTGDGVSLEGDAIPLHYVHYYDTPSVMDPWTGMQTGTMDHVDVMRRILHTADHGAATDGTPAGEGTDRFDATLREALDAEILPGAEEFVSDGNRISVRNMAAGMKVFAVLRVLMDKGLLDERSVLLLDEPEVHLHPEWVNVLARVVAVLVANMGVRVLMTTHSSQLLMAVQGACRETGIEPSMLMLSGGPDGIALQDLTGRPGDMHREMAEAFKVTEDLFWGDG